MFDIFQLEMEKVPKVQIPMYLQAQELQKKDEKVAKEIIKDTNK